MLSGRSGIIEELVLDDLQGQLPRRLPLGQSMLLLFRAFASNCLACLEAQKHRFQ